MDLRKPKVLNKGATHCLLVLVAFFGAGVTDASPWLDPGDTGIRNEIQLLADAGVIKSPVTTWPMAWADVARELTAFEDADQLDGITAIAYRHLRERVAAEKRIGSVRVTGYLAGASNPTLIRTFEDTTCTFRP